MAPQPVDPSAPGQTAAAPASKAGGRRYQIILGSIFAGMTVLALALAALAPEIGAAATSPAPPDWQTLYQHDLTTADTAAWDVTHGCAFTAQGLDAEASDSTAAVCEFTLAGAGGATGAGFYFEVKLIPAADVAAFERAILLVGDTSDQTGQTLAFEVGQDGSYIICDGACSAGHSLYISGGTAAWHGDAFVPNTIGVRVSADHSQETFFVNGQKVGEAGDDVGANPALAAGSPAGSDVIFTSATFSTGQ
jgi:hypothetical protein